MNGYRGGRHRYSALLPFASRLFPGIDYTWLKPWQIATLSRIVLVYHTVTLDKNDFHYLEMRSTAKKRRKNVIHPSMIKRGGSNLTAYWYASFWGLPSFLHFSSCELGITFTTYARPFFKENRTILETSFICTKGFFTISQDKVEIKIFLNWTVTIEIVLISVFPWIFLSQWRQLGHFPALRSVTPWWACKY